MTDRRTLIRKTLVDQKRGYKFFQWRQKEREDSRGVQKINRPDNRTMKIFICWRQIMIPADRQPQVELSTTWSSRTNQETTRYQNILMAKNENNLVENLRTCIVCMSPAVNWKCQIPIAKKHRREKISQTGPETKLISPEHYTTNHYETNRVY